MRTMYTLGFIFDLSQESVLLITKNRPENQKGKLNGIGGHIEKNEEPLAAFLREVKEESKLILNKDAVQLVGYMQSPEWLVHVYATVYPGKKDDAAAITDEKIDWYAVEHLPHHVMTNLRWLIPLSLDMLADDNLQTASITYI